MSPFNEHTLELAIMELFTQQGYNYQSGETIHQELSEELQWVAPVLKPYNAFGDDSISMAVEP